MKPYIFILLYSCLSMLSCTKKQVQESAEQVTTTQEKRAEMIKISAEQFKNLHLEVGKIRPISMNDEIKATGVVEVPPENFASISVPIAGFIKSISPNNSLPGKYIAKGTILATIECLEFIQMQQDYLQAIARSTYLEKELERQQMLSAEDIGAKKKLQQAEAEFNGNRALLKSLEAKLKILGISPDLKKQDISPVIHIIAPINGYIKSANVSIGKSVSPNDILFELINKKDLHLELKILEKDAFKIKIGQKVLVEDARLGNNVLGTVFMVGQAFEGETRAINVHVHINNIQQEQKLIPGMFINAKIMTGNRITQSLPESAILREAEGNFIFIIDKQDSKEVSFKKIPISLGVVQQGNIEIGRASDITATTLVILKNGHFLSSMGGTDTE